jgi:hypothetical protein
MVAELPDCDDLWSSYFGPWYSPADLKLRAYSATKPDAESAFRPKTSAAKASVLTQSGCKRIADQLETMRRAVQNDWPSYLQVQLPIDLRWIDAFDTYWTRARVHDVLERSDPKDFSNELLVLACELGVALAEVMRCSTPQLQWLYSAPYWESSLLDVPSGYAVNVFDWGLKRFSEDGVEDGYAAKTEMLLELVRRGWSQ